jgi:ABC-2 type transport system ATP-binding protein
VSEPKEKLPNAGSAPDDAGAAGPRQPTIKLQNVSRFYGEVLGVNRVTLSIPPGITSLVGPNGSGKTTLMNLIAGLIRPSKGTIEVRGISPSHPEQLQRILGYATQFDSFPKGLTGFEFIYFYLRLFGFDAPQAKELANAAIARVRMTEAAGRRVAAYSKGMRQRIKLAQAIAHDPMVLVLDEPLNGLDPLVRAQTIELFREFARGGRHVLVSSHVLHEVDLISDQVVMLSNGYIVAEGHIHDVRGEISDEPMRIVIRCDRPSELASRVFQLAGVVEVRMLDRDAALVKTHDPDRFYLAINRMALDGIRIEGVWPADDDVNSVYQYLIGNEGAAR